MENTGLWYEPKNVVLVLVALSMLIGILVLFFDRYKRDKGLNVRAIQVLSIITILPSIVILGLGGVLDGSAIGTLLGALVGYLFANISKYDEKANSDN